MAKSHEPDPRHLPPERPPAPAHDDTGKEPAHGTAKAAEAAGPLPRVVDPLERAPEGCCRFKIACRNYTPRAVKYILAKKGEKAEDEARACYLKATKLDEELARLKKNAGPKADDVEPPALVVTALPD